MCFSGCKTSEQKPPSSAPDCGTTPGAPTAPCPYCTVNSVTLSVSKTTLTLKHDRESVVEIKVDPATAVVESARIEIQRTTETAWKPLSPVQRLAPWQAKIAGTFRLRGVVKVCGTEYTTAPQNVEVKFPTYAQITSDAGLVALLDALWASTLADCTLTPVNQRRELGAWIRLNTTSNAYELGPTAQGAFSRPADGASVSLPPRMADAPAAPEANAAGATYSVASFHTHTPTEFRAAAVPAGSTRGVGPSTGDNTADTGDNVPGVVYDYVEASAGSGDIPMGHPKSSAARLYKSLGVDPRPTP